MTLQLDTKLHHNVGSQVAFRRAKVDARLDKFYLKLKFLLIAILLSDLRVESFEQESVDVHFVGAEMVNNPICVYGEFEPVLSFHGFHEAIGDTVGHNELEILALIVVLEIVVMLIGRHQAMVSLRANIRKERKVELMVVDLRVCRQTPIQQEVTLFLELGDSKLEWLKLIIESLLSHII